MRRKAIVMLMVLATAAVLAGGCKNKQAQPDASNTPSSAVTLKWWGGVPEENGPSAVVDAWNAKNKDSQIEYVRFVNDDSGNTRLDTALLSAADAPDLFFSYSEFQLDRRVKGEMAEPLEKLIEKSGFDLEGIIGSKNVMKYNRGIYYLPATMDIRFFAFNKASLDAIGEEVPRAGWTWDEFAELSKKLTKPGQYGTFFNPTWEPIAYDVLSTVKPHNPYYQKDGSSTNFDEPAFREGLELQKGLLDAKATMPYLEGIAFKAQTQDELLKEKAASVYASLYFVRYIKDDKTYPDRKFQIAFAPTPRIPGGSGIDKSKHGDYLSINSKSAHKEEAMRFMVWYLTEGNLHMVPGGRVPSSKKVNLDQIADLIIGDKGQYFDRESFERLLKGRYMPIVATNTTASTVIRQIFMEEAEKYFMNAQSIDTTVAEIKRRADEAVQKASR
ncbi:extracellular solute-binding protein [Paenibacillus pasadenensis]|uniref:ABC transporter substrate-binding protein n=1 Tax=Paenibacillus pasadenensis TaxID=217090 RepID=UPI00203D9FC1|nr:extracellular solute-binding protein [Paenibacillus pasadenensis]MCM3747111.1 extracellular solute-binding protein [Paenibacillus pasadenensis]